MKNPFNLVRTSVGKRQLVSLTGLILLSCLTIILGANFLLLAAPKLFDQTVTILLNYQLRVLIGLSFIFLIFLAHIVLILQIAHRNSKARVRRYRVYRSKGRRSLTTGLMPYTGALLLGFVGWNGYELYNISGNNFVYLQTHSPSGIIYSAFSDPLYSTFYIVTMAALGFQFSQSLENVVQSFGLRQNKSANKTESIATKAGTAIALTFGFVPLYILIKSYFTI